MCSLPELGKVDREAGEFWVDNAFNIIRNGHNLSAFERNRVYMNLQGKSFIDVSFASNADIDSDSRAVIAADFNSDGAPDLLVGSDGGGPLRLFLNRFPKANRVRIELIGVDSNRQAIGSRIVIQVGDRKIIRDLLPANGFMGQSPPELLIGIGAATKIDSLTVRWPTGKTQRFLNLHVREKLTIREGQETIAR